MNFGRLKKWISGNNARKARLRLVAFLYIAFLMLPERKHTLEAVAGLSGSTRARYCKFLQKHSIAAILSLSELSKNRRISSQIS